MGYGNRLLISLFGLPRFEGRLRPTLRQLSPTGETAMKDNKAVRCPEDEHDWCEIPLHEEGRICAQCGEIRHDLLCFTSVEPALTEIPILSQACPPL